MSNTTAVIERELLARSINGDECSMTLKIGMPARSTSAAWQCMVEISRLFSPAKPIFGEDSWQAMQLAQSFAITLLEHFEAQGGKLFWPRAARDDELCPLYARELLPAACS